MPGIAYVWDVPPGVETGRFRYVSPRIQDILGFSPEEWHRVRPVSTRTTATRRRAVDAASRPASRSEEYRYLAKDGSVVWVLDHATLITHRTQRRARRCSRG